MTAITNYNLDKALNYLGPKDLNGFELKGFSDHLKYIVDNIAISILRLLNTIFGDHIWYNNQTARTIVVQHLTEDQPKDQKIRNIFDELLFRKYHWTNYSYQEGLVWPNLLSETSSFEDPEQASFTFETSSGDLSPPDIEESPELLERALSNLELAAKVETDLAHTPWEKLFVFKCREGFNAKDSHDARYDSHVRELRAAIEEQDPKQVSLKLGALISLIRPSIAKIKIPHSDPQAQFNPTHFPKIIKVFEMVKKLAQNPLGKERACRKNLAVWNVEGGVCLTQITKRLNIINGKDP